MEHAAGFVLLRVRGGGAGSSASAGDSCDGGGASSLRLERVREDGARIWTTQILAARGGSKDGEATLLEPSDEAAQELLQAAGRVIAEHKLPYELRLLPCQQPASTCAGGAAGGAACAAAAEAGAVCSCGGGGCDGGGVRLVKLSLGLDSSLLEGPLGASWKRSPSAALLFKHLLPQGADEALAAREALLTPETWPWRQQQKQQQQGGGGCQRYTLLSCFRELPTVSTAPPPVVISITGQQQQQQQQQQEQQHRGAARPAAPGQAPVPPQPAVIGGGAPPRPQQQQQQQQEEGQQQQLVVTAAAAAAAAAGGGSSLADVPPEVMSQLLGRLTANDLARLACCCRGLRSSSWEAVPGLKLVLYPHQRNALSWMLHRETHGGQPMPHPFIQDRSTSSGFPFCINQVTGELSVEPPPRVSDIRGGFFCDEPGLGKTVTALALILKTQGLTPSPPPGASVTWVTLPSGRRAGFYSPPEGAATGGGEGGGWQDEDAAAAAAGEGPPGGSGRRGGAAMRRSASSGSAGAALGSLRAGAWTIAPSLRGSSIRRKSRAQQAAAEAAAAVAAASFSDADSGGGAAARASGRKRKAPGEAPPPSALGGRRRQQQQQQSKGGAAGARRRSSSTSGSARAAAAAAAPSAPGPQLRRLSSSSGGGEALTSPRRAAAVKAGSKIQQQLDSDSQEEDQEGPGERAGPGAAAHAPQPRPRRCSSADGGGGTAGPAGGRSRLASGAGAAADGGRRGAAGGSEEGSSAAEESSGPGGSSDSDFPAPGQRVRRPRSSGRRQPAAQRQQAAAQPPPNDSPERHPAKRPKLEQQQQQQPACNGAGGRRAGPGEQEDELGPEWVMCDHCSKWRTLPAGYTLGSELDGLPWFCCLHPVPDMASCLVPEEPHESNTAMAAAPADGLGYESLPGFLAAEPPAAAARRRRGGGPDELEAEPDESNVAHFAAVFASIPEFADSAGLHRAALWLSTNDPEDLLRGVTVPREVVSNAPGYGRLFALLSLQRVAPQGPKPFGRKGKAAGVASSGAQGQQEQQQRTTAAQQSLHAQPLAADAAAPGGGAGGGGGGGGGGGSGRPQRPSKPAGSSYVAAQHRWRQPPSCNSLRLDVVALRVALATGAGSSPRIFLSPATLVIVPTTLIPHWQQQIRQHLLPRRLRVLVLGSASAIAAGSDAAAGPGAAQRTVGSSSNAAAGGGAAATVCPPPHELAWCYDVVITTIQRLSSDWSMRGDPRLAERLVLLKVHWLRVIIDEGHSLGASLALTNKLAMAVQLSAARRWVMTGTPTPATTSGSGASHLQPLLSFLHQQPFGSSRAAWDGCVARPLEAGAAAEAAAAAAAAPQQQAGALAVAEWGRKQMLALLSRVMIRSCKADLALLPPCYRKVTLLDFAPAHAASYNALVEVIRRNLLLADWCDDSHNESLLNARQSRWAKEMLRNVRLACCVAGLMSLVVKDEDVLETLELLSGRLGLPAPAKELRVLPCLLGREGSGTSRAEQQEQEKREEEQAAALAAVESAAAAEAPAAAAAGAGGGVQAAPGADDKAAAAGAEAVAAAEAAGTAAASAAAAAPPQHEVPATPQGDAKAAPPAAADAVAPGGADAGAPGGAAAAPAAPAAAPASPGVVLRQRWFFTGPGHPLHSVEEGLRQGCACQVCGEVTHLPMVTPCAHMLCTDCTAPHRTCCPVCRVPYRMQEKDDPTRFDNNPAPKWEVPLDVIEWQPVYHQKSAVGLGGGEWSANWKITKSTKIQHLLRRLMEVGIYCPGGSGAQHQPGHHQQGPASQHHQHHQQHQQQQQPQRPGAVKAIVFSQFWMHLLLVAAELGARRVPHILLKRDMAARDKQAAVTAFRATATSSCLVMDESGALGLDLSFVRHIFLLEPIADAALEQQVVSRAHRMGAVAPVHVEVLAMRNTAEEHLVALRHQAAAGMLSSAAADAAAAHAAAAVAGAAADAGPPAGEQEQQPPPAGSEREPPPAGAAAEAPGAPRLSPPRQQRQQQQQQRRRSSSAGGGEEVGGATAAAAATDVSNITNFISVGGGGNQLDSRALRNLVLLHLRKVSVIDLPELPEDAGSAEPGIGGGAGAESSAAAAAGATTAGTLWSDVALPRRQQDQQQQQEEEGQAGGAGAGGGRRVAFALPAAREAAGAAGGTSGPAAAAAAEPDSKPHAKRARFADEP